MFVDRRGYHDRENFACGDIAAVGEGDSYNSEACPACGEWEEFFLKVPELTIRTREIDDRRGDVDLGLPMSSWRVAPVRIEDLGHEIITARRQDRQASSSRSDAPACLFPFLNRPASDNQGKDRIAVCDRRRRWKARIEPSRCR